ncbi:MAG: hypothetical protein IPL53_08205 [Ignavibacteria bacterium]|nr:hypothetical protein [Ignavibacteria bacterium]
MKDISLIYLRSHLSPYSIVDSASVLIDSVSLSGTCYFSAQSGNYYIAVKHRNSIETWSANPVAISFTTTNYDFTIGSSQAFANNVVFKFGKWCTYSGDVNQDASINLNDVILVYNNANNFVTGYSATDVTGNNITDLSDLLITFNNANSFVVKITP